MAEVGNTNTSLDLDSARQKYYEIMQNYNEEKQKLAKYKAKKAKLREVKTRENTLKTNIETSREKVYNAKEGFFGVKASDAWMTKQIQEVGSSVYDDFKDLNGKLNNIASQISKQETYLDETIEKIQESMKNLSSDAATYRYAVEDRI